MTQPASTTDASRHAVDDSLVTSAEYIRAHGMGCSTGDMFDVNFHHPLEKWLGRRLVRRLLARLAREGSDGTTAIERILASYRNPAAPRRQRLKYWAIHRFIDKMRGKTDVATFRKRLSENRPTVRGMVIVARSIAEFGLTVPQRFSAPLFAVWNFTNRCNLACRHCYQSSTHSLADGELTRTEKLSLIDQMGHARMPMLAFSGGEPTLSEDLLPAIERAASWGMHMSLATNGTTMTPELAGKLAASGMRYVEISLDSVDPARHDAFRGVKGMWQRSVAGAKVVVATPGLRLGVAMCVHQGNVGEVERMIDFASELGAECFAHFNFIPVGRGLKMVSGDITPQQREGLLEVLNRTLQSKKIGVISTAPQFGRVCLAGSSAESGRTACSHAGSGVGVKARVVAKYLGGCGAGRTYACIEPNGDVTPCVYLPHRVMGNVRNATLVDIFREKHMGDGQDGIWELLNDRKRREHHCGACSFANYCGGCRARSDAYFGGLDFGDPGCVFNQKQWDELVASGVAVAPTPDAAPENFELTPTRHSPG